MISRSQKGFTLVETLVAISLLVVGVMAPMAIAAKGLQSAFYAKEHLTAVYLAQESIELLRMKRDDYSLAHTGSSTDNWSGTVNAACFLSTGCDIGARTFAYRNCATAANGCTLRYDDNAITGNLRAMYQYTSGSLSPFTRTMVLESINGGKEIKATVTVSWRANVFAGTKVVTLQSTLFDPYDAL